MSEEVSQQVNVARDIERVWMVRTIAAISSAAMMLGYLWLQNIYQDQRLLRIEFNTLSSLVATINVRQGDVRETNRDQQNQIKELNDRLERMLRARDPKPQNQDQIR